MLTTSDYDNMETAWKHWCNYVRTSMDASWPSWDGFIGLIDPNNTPLFRQMVASTAAHPAPQPLAELFPEIDQRIRKLAGPHHRTILRLNHEKVEAVLARIRLNHEKLEAVLAKNGHKGLVFYISSCEPKSRIVHVQNNSNQKQGDFFTSHFSRSNSKKYYISQSKK